jgi:hypothetical protein
MGFLGALLAVPVGLVIYTVAKYLTDRIPEHPRAPLGAVDEEYEREMERMHQQEAARLARGRKFGKKKAVTDTAADE